MHRFPGPLENVGVPPPFTSEVLSKRSRPQRERCHPTSRSFFSASHRSSTLVELHLANTQPGPTAMSRMAAPKTTSNRLNAKSSVSLPSSAIASCPPLFLHLGLWRLGTRI